MIRTLNYPSNLAGENDRNEPTQEGNNENDDPNQEQTLFLKAVIYGQKVHTRSQN